MSITGGHKIFVRILDGPKIHAFLHVYTPFLVVSTSNSRPYHTMVPVFIRTHDGPKIHAFRHVYTPFLVPITIITI